MRSYLAAMRRMARADGRWRPYLPRQQPESADTKITASEGRLRIARTISAWQSGWGPVRSDGRARAAPARSYLAVMRRNYQRERPKMIRPERTKRRACAQISPAEGSRPSAKGARATCMCSDLSRREILGHDNKQNDDVRSEGCCSIVDGRRQGRRLSANLISDGDQERPRTEKHTDLGNMRSAGRVRGGTRRRVQAPGTPPAEEPPGWEDELPPQGRASPGRCDRPRRTHVRRTRAQISPAERS